MSTFSNREEKRKAVVRAVTAYMNQGLNKSAAVKRVSIDFGYLSEVPVWNALKKEKEEVTNG